MAVYRVEKTENFTVLSNHQFKDFGLSWKAKGLLSNMLSLPEDWKYSVVGLSKLTSDGVDSTRRGLLELEEKGYLVRRPVKEKGRIIGWEYDIYEVPQKKNPEEDDPEADNPGVEEPNEGNADAEESDKDTPAQLNTIQSIPKGSSTKGSRTNGSNASEGAPAYYPLDEELNGVLLEYIEHRKKLKRPMAENAVYMLMEKLDEMTPDNNEKIAILKQSIINGWIGIHILQEDKEKKQQKNSTAADDFAELVKEFEEGEGGFIYDY